MNKTALTHVKDRIASVVRCTNGTISTKLNKQLKDVKEYTLEEKLKLIKDKKAKLISLEQLTNTNANYNSNLLSVLVRCCTYPEPKGNKEAITHNRKVQAKIDDLHREVTLEGTRMYDAVVLGIVKADGISTWLTKISDMAGIV